MSNGIAARQNEPDSINKLAAYKQLYQEVGYLGYLSFILSVVMPMFFAVLCFVFDSNIAVRNISYLSTIAICILSVWLENQKQRKKQLASSIQLLFDIYVFDMDWDKKLFGINKNLNSIIVQKASKYLKKKSRKQYIFNWYNPLVDNCSSEIGIRECQKENIRWDLELRKRIRLLSIAIIATICLIITFLCSLINSHVVEVYSYFIFILPILDWFLRLTNALCNDIKRLESFDDVVYSKKHYSISDLKLVQKNIYDHRANAVKIPDLIYDLTKDDDEKREESILKTDIKNDIN